MSSLHRAALRSWAERERVAHPTEGQRSSNLGEGDRQAQLSKPDRMICIKGMPTIMAKVRRSRRIWITSFTCTLGSCSIPTYIFLRLTFLKVPLWKAGSMQKWHV
jgi:hypothetical protein